MASFKEVRAMQREGRNLKRRYLAATDPRTGVRDAVGYANDCAFQNPPPHADAVTRERWATRWFTAFSRKTCPR